MKNVKSILVALLLIAGVGFNQALAQNKDAKMMHSKEVNKSADEVWKVLRKMDDIDKYSSNIAKVDWEGNKGIGGIRVCWTPDGKGYFKERIVGFDDATRSFSYSLLEGAPVKGMINTLKVVDQGYNKSKIVWWTNYEEFMKNPNMTKDQFHGFMKMSITEFADKVAAAASASM